MFIDRIEYINRGSFIRVQRTGPYLLRLSLKNLCDEHIEFEGYGKRLGELTNVNLVVN